MSDSIDPEVHTTRIGDMEHAPEFLKQIKGQEIDGKAVVYPHRRSDQISVVHGRLRMKQNSCRIIPDVII